MEDCVVDFICYGCCVMSCLSQRSHFSGHRLHHRCLGRSYVHWLDCNCWQCARQCCWRVLWARNGSVPSARGAGWSYASSAAHDWFEFSKVANGAVARIECHSTHHLAAVCTSSNRSSQKLLHMREQAPPLNSSKSGLSKSRFGRKCLQARDATRTCRPESVMNCLPSRMAYYN